MMIMIQVSLLLEVLWLNGCFVVPVSDEVLELEDKGVGVWR